MQLTEIPFAFALVHHRVAVRRYVLRTVKAASANDCAERLYSALITNYCQLHDHEHH